MNKENKYKNIVLNEITREVKVFNNQYEAASYMGGTGESVRVHLVRERPRIFEHFLVFKYSDEILATLQPQG